MEKIVLGKVSTPDLPDNVKDLYELHELSSKNKFLVSVNKSDPVCQTLLRNLRAVNYDLKVLNITKIREKMKSLHPGLEEQKSQYTSIEFTEGNKAVTINIGDFSLFLSENEIGDYQDTYPQIAYFVQINPYAIHELPEISNENINNMVKSISSKDMKYTDNCKVLEDLAQKNIISRSFYRNNWNESTVVYSSSGV